MTTAAQHTANRLSTGTNDWRTPRHIFDWLDREFSFTLDAAADDDNHLCERYFTEQTNALVHDWCIYVGSSGEDCRCLCHPCTAAGDGAAVAASLFLCSACMTCRALPATVFVNPPYGKDAHGKSLQAPFFSHALLQAGLLGVTSVLLVPARIETTWWHEFVCHADEVRFIRGRIAFTRADGMPVANNTTGSSIVVFRRSRRREAGQPLLSFVEQPADPAARRTMTKTERRKAA